MSAILISDVSGPQLAILDERECGYDRVIVQATKIRPFGDTYLHPGQQEVFIYVGKPHKYNPDLEPNADYLKLCVGAAGEWGEMFHDSFLRTTFASGAPLAESASCCSLHSRATA